MRSLDYSRSYRVYLKPGFTDMRKGNRKGIMSDIRTIDAADPFENSLFLFMRSENILNQGNPLGRGRILLPYEAFEKEKFQWPKNNERSASLSEQQLRWLLEGSGDRAEMFDPQKPAT
ncbi:IS66 family insertion sequence element accessory protein TnpB [Dubosiella newyorkensis]|uniref:IS66 family insertion sequence element accessory protein TnpB n=1 Tax=Dubosiella newyorkensis TaxID=1862672 RepID=UPI003F66ABF0